MMWSWTLLSYFLVAVQAGASHSGTSATTIATTTLKTHRATRTTMKPVDQVLRSAPTPPRPKLMLVFGSSANPNGTASRRSDPEHVFLYERASDVPEEPSKELLPPVDGSEYQYRHDGQEAGYLYPRPQQDVSQPDAGYLHQDDQKPSSGYQYTKPQQDVTQTETGYHYSKPQQDDQKPSSGYQYPKPQQDVTQTETGYHYSKPQQDDQKPSSGYQYPKPQQDVTQPESGYNYPKPQQDKRKPSPGYHYYKPQQDMAKPEAGYTYQELQQNDHKPHVGYQYTKPQQDTIKPDAGQQQDRPATGYQYPRPQHDESEQQYKKPSPTYGVSQPVEQDYLPPKEQLPLEDDPKRPPYGPPANTATSKPPTLLDELPYSYLPPPPVRDETPGNSYVPPEPQDSYNPVRETYPRLPVREYIPIQKPQEDPVQLLPQTPPSGYLPPQRDPQPPSREYIPVQKPQVDPVQLPPQIPSNSYLPPQRDPQHPSRESIPVQNKPQVDSMQVHPQTPLPAQSDPRPPPQKYIPAQNPQDAPPQDPPGAYLPPQSDPQPPVREYIPVQKPQADPAYLPPQTSSLPQSDPSAPVAPASQPWRAYLPPPLNDITQSVEDADDSLAYKSVKSRHLKSGSADEHGIRVTDMSCLRTGSRARFTATITSPVFATWPPVLEGVLGPPPPGCRVIADPADPHRRFLVDLSHPDLTRCGVKGCSSDGEARLCARILMPRLPGLRLASDPLLLLQCSLQPATAYSLQQAKIAASQPASGRSAGSVHAGGERAHLHAQLQLFRRAPAGPAAIQGDFTRQMQPGSGAAVQLGEELQLRAVVRKGDGWQSSRLSDVVVRRLAAPAQDAVHLLEQDGCVSADMQAVCPRQQGWLAGEPLVSLLSMRVFMFRGMQDGEHLLVSARVVACLDRADCKLSSRHCGGGAGAERQRRGAPGNTTTSVLEETVTFRVHLPGLPGLPDNKSTFHSASSSAMRSLRTPLLALLGMLVTSISAATSFTLAYYCRRDTSGT